MIAGMIQYRFEKKADGGKDTETIKRRKVIGTITTLKNREEDL